MVGQGGGAAQEAAAEDEGNPGEVGAPLPALHSIPVLPHQVEEDLSRAAKSRRRELEKLMRNIKVHNRNLLIKLCITRPVPGRSLRLLGMESKKNFKVW